jgi:hypothetical protein
MFFETQFNELRRVLEWISKRSLSKK